MIGQDKHITLPFFDKGKINSLEIHLSIGGFSIRIIVLLGQCNSQLERTQQSVRFHEQWQNALQIVQVSFEIYQRQLMEIRQEQDAFIDLDAIQVNQ